MPRRAGPLSELQSRSIMQRLLLTSLLLVITAATACSRQPDPAAATPIATETVVFEVQGMHCNGCADAIATKTGRVDGVTGCEVSLENGTATVEVDPASIGDVEAAIASLGYTVSPAQP